jgi:hypothetical protein
MVDDAEGGGGGASKAAAAANDDGGGGGGGARSRSASRSFFLPARDRVSSRTDDAALATAARSAASWSSRSRVQDVGEHTGPHTTAFAL